MQQVKLDRITSPLSDDHKVIYKNYQLVINNLKKLINVLVNENWSDPIYLKIISDYPGNELGRGYFNWRKKVISSLNQLINLVGNELNTKELLEPPFYEELDHVGLWMPWQSILDDSYKNKMNNNFTLIEKRINTFYLIFDDAKLTIKE